MVNMDTEWDNLMYTLARCTMRRQALSLFYDRNNMFTFVLSGTHEHSAKSIMFPAWIHTYLYYRVAEHIVQARRRQYTLDVTKAIAKGPPRPSGDVFSSDIFKSTIV